jgi:hypothetical protein
MLGRLAEETGACLLLLDDPPETGKKDGYGASFNVNSMRGVVLHLEVVMPGEVGLCHLYVRKDRHARVTTNGGIPQDDQRVYVGDVTLDGRGALDWSGDTAAISIVIEPPGTKSEVQAVSTVSRLRELLSDDTYVFTSYAELAKALRIRNREVVDAAKWLMSQKVMEKRNGRFVLLDSPPQGLGALILDYEAGS